MAWKRLADYVGLTGPTPSDEIDTQRRNPDVRRDYTMAEPRENEELHWVATPKSVVAHPTHTAQEILDLMEYDESLPHAYGTAEVHYNWEVLWHVDQSTMALHLLEKLLKKETRNHSWKFEGITDAQGVAIDTKSNEKHATAPGIGQNNPGLMEWSTGDGDGNWGQDVKQVDYYGIDDPRDGAGCCPECNIPLPNYDAWVRHMPEHVQSDELSDDIFPAEQNQVTPENQMWSSLRQRHAHMQRVSAPAIPGPMPFIYDVEGDTIYAGHPGERQSDIKGKFSPGGVVRGYYLPNGEMHIRAFTDMPYTLYQMTRIWYYLYPELQVKSISMLTDTGEKVKLASTSIAHKVRNLAHTNEAARTAMTALLPHGNVYVVGGAVRDTVLGKTPKDIDLVVEGMDHDTVIDSLHHLGKVSPHGKAFGVILFKAAGDEVEIALPRVERSTGVGHRDFEVTASGDISLDLDLARRDFSVNSMAVCLRTAVLIDPYDGSLDVKSGTFSAPNERAFDEDPLRILRALTLVSRHGLMPDEDARARMAASKDKLRHLSAERVGMEMDKILAGDQPHVAIRMAIDLGLFEHWLPEIQALDNFDQKNKHHSRKLDDHTLKVLSNMASRTQDVDLRWAALLHDIGKPKCGFWHSSRRNG
jgi:tRNA nucleotidyltransferase/poly(A) polymerase